MKYKIAYSDTGKVVKCEVDGKECTHEEYLAATAHLKRTGPVECPSCAGNTPTCWPMKSDSQAVHPKLIQAAMARDRRNGVKGVSYDPVDGRVIFADQGAMRMFCKDRGVHQNNGGYGTDHHISERAPEIDPAAVSAAKFLDGASGMKQDFRGKR
jgi:hypothetical protein